jgi:hypothetical protein
MPNIKYSKEDLEKFKQLYPTTNNHELGKMFNASYKAVTSLAKRLGVVKAETYKKIPIDSPWNDEIDNKLRDLYADTPNPELARMFNTTVSSIKNRSKLLNIYKSEAFMKEHSGKFKKGMHTWNKGVKGYMGANSGSFKKGNQPSNTKHDNAISIRNDGGRKYKFIRISKSVWKPLHVYKYEKKYGPIPEGHILIFKNRDTLDCSLSNIRLISREQHIEETRQSDSFIAKSMAIKKGFKGKYDKELKDLIMKRPDLIEVKRVQLKLNKEIKNARRK